MYYSNITNKELQAFRDLKVPNFTVTLSDILTSDLFRKETVITDSIYKVIPLFYVNTITSSNPNDKILDDKCIICQKTDEETYITFISNPDENIMDYRSYADYYDIGDTLTTNEYNGIVSLLKHNSVHKLDFEILETITGDYGEYLFDLDDVTFLDNGILITDETISAEPKVKLINNFFKYSTYTLKLQVMHYTGVNIKDYRPPSNNKVIDTLEIELIPNTWVDIPVTDLEEGYIILYDASIEIHHDKTEIHCINGLEVNAKPNPIQTDETSEIFAQLLDYDGDPYDINDASGKTVYFYEKLTPTLTVTATPPIIQSSETSDITAKVKDSDGSIAKNTKTYFYERTNILIDNRTIGATQLTLLHDLKSLTSQKWKFTCQYKADTESRVFIGNKATATGNPNYSVFIGSPNGVNIAYYGDRDTSTHPTDINGYNVTQYTEVGIARNGNTFTFTLNGTSYTKTVTWFDNYSDYVIGLVAWQIGGTGSVSVKDIKFTIEEE